MVTTAAVCWLGAVAGQTRHAAWIAVALVGGATVAAMAARRVGFPMAIAMSVALACGGLSGHAAERRTATTLATSIPEGQVEIIGRALDDPRLDGRRSVALLRPEARFEYGTLQPWAGPTLLLEGDPPLIGDVRAGARVHVRGRSRSGGFRYRGDPVAGVVRVDTLAVAPDDQVLFRAGNTLRYRVLDLVMDRSDDSADGLVAGFLVGDTSGVASVDADNMRRAGLSHFTAVSGSNVALFLAAWWLVLGPLSRGSRMRPLLGLVGAVVFVVATRWEPSVVRAATMAGLVLAARALGVHLDRWTALGGAVAALVLVSGDLAVDVGFQLSVVATAGVLTGARLFTGRSPRWLWNALGAAGAAQLAVSPVLIWHFGTVPLMSPIANVIATPFVLAATTLGGAGVLLGAGGVVDVALVPARIVLAVADAAARWPQLAWLEMLGAVAVLGLVAVAPATRKPAAVVALVWLAASIGLPARAPSQPTLIVLDVGQGDAIVFRDPSGANVLVDGGEDPARLRNRLDRHGVRRLDLLIATHGDADHIGGLADIRLPVGQFWYPDHPDNAEALSDLVTSLAARGVSTITPRVGDTVVVGSLTLSVLGPNRRYVSENDGGIVLEVHPVGGGTSVYLAADTERYAHRDLEPVTADVLKVPHHGAATTDLDWLAQSTSRLAVISVGADNPFGHPSAEVIQVLEEIGARVVRTDEVGDVVLPLGRR